MKRKLFLIPTHMGHNEPLIHLPEDTISQLFKITEFIVENERTARRFLISINYHHDINDVSFHILNKHTNPSEISSFICNKSTNNIGLISEAGCPCIADPGAEIVKIAHENNIQIIPLVGPSSILMALMASGFNGQQFTFHGYLPIKNDQKRKKIKEIESYIYKFNQTQIFIETPYRNIALFETLIQVCNKSTKLCIASEITLPTESITIMTISNWKKKRPDINKKTVVFLLYK